MKCINQRTIKNEIEIKGIGLHSGEPVKLKLKPASSFEGISFEKNGEFHKTRDRIIYCICLATELTSLEVKNERGININRLSVFY
jgi:UDP-3-O-[3-hydroxymyristoyl] N-acetylglucosamine deacetylase